MKRTRHGSQGRGPEEGKLIYLPTMKPVATNRRIFFAACPRLLFPLLLRILRILRILRTKHAICRPLNFPRSTLWKINDNSTVSIRPSTRLSPDRNLCEPDKDVVSFRSRGPVSTEVTVDDGDIDLKAIRIDVSLIATPRSTVSRHS